MANITVRKDGGAAAPHHEPQPLRRARDFFGWDPFREMAPGSFGEPSAFAPAFEVKETRDGYVFQGDLPGVDEKHLDITVTGNRLTMSGKREAEHEEKGDTWYTRECSYGSFTRSFTLPEGIDADHIRGELRDGVLTVVIPKTQEAKPKKISLSRLFGRRH